MKKESHIETLESYIHNNEILTRIHRTPRNINKYTQKMTDLLAIKMFIEEEEQQ